jgi:hypothetical protein
LPQDDLARRPKAIPSGAVSPESLQSPPHNPDISGVKALDNKVALDDSLSHKRGDDAATFVQKELSAEEGQMERPKSTIEVLQNPIISTLVRVSASNVTLRHLIESQHQNAFHQECS